MKERPILFSGPMVRAILEGRKTQTRRIINPQPPDQPLPNCHPRNSVKHPAPYLDAYCSKHKTAINPRGMSDLWCWWQVDDRQCLPTFRCPYGQPGDRLWVRETWAQVHPIQVSEGRFSLKGRAGIPGPPPVDYRVIYRADGEYPRIHFQDGDPKYPYRELCVEGCKREHIHPEERWNGWAASAFMPRWASRITLEIVSVRVERLQDISEDDAKAEGVIESYRPAIDPMGLANNYTVEFFKLWKSINGPGSWVLNPWVWVVEFKEVKP